MAAAGGVVVDVTEQTFNSDVVQRSRTTPVIIYLWAKWCGPCHQLGPVLEKLATEAGGQWILAKVDVDANPQLSAALQVKSIPMVVAAVGGQLVDGFLGAMPEAQLSPWLSQILTTAGWRGVSGWPGGCAAHVRACRGAAHADVGLDGGAGRHGRVVLVTGEAGIGKTRLVAELARRADNAGARIAVGSGVDVGGEAPLAVWQELVPQLARTVPIPPGQADWPAELGRLAPDIAARLGRDEPPPVVSSPELERLRVFDAVLRLVEWAAAGRRCCWLLRTCTAPTRPACSCVRTSAGGWLPGRCCSC